MMKATTTSFLAFLMMAVSLQAADNWTRFRGPNGSGISSDSNVPVTWSDAENLKWKTKLPGAGSSSPIVVGDRVFVTCYSGYGVDADNSGRLENLERQLVCVRRQDGDILWSKSVAAVLPEDPYQGMGLPEHGYASNSPVSEGERVYAFFGKTGVFAFDLDGNRLWQKDVGQESSKRRWGSAASLILHKGLVIVNASEESQSVRALNTTTGEEVWKAEASGLELTYGTPLIIQPSSGSKQVLLAVPEELWALDAQTGKLAWYATTGLTGNASPSVVAGDGVVYVFGGYPRQGSVAVRIGGKGDVTADQVVWKSRTGPYVPTPVLHEGHLYWINRRGVAVCMNASNGEVVFEERLRSSAGSPRYYASPVLAEGRLYAPSRNTGTFVLAAKPKFEQIAQNRFASDVSDFNATPAISNSEIFLRSDNFLHCVSLSGRK